MTPLERSAQDLRECDDAYQKLLRRALVADPKDYLGVVNALMLRQSGLTAEQFEAWVQESEEYRALHLPGPTAPGFTRKTRDQVCAVQTNFCNLRDRTGQPQFSPFACALPPAQQEEWIQNEVAAGSTHFVVAVDVNSTAYLPPEGHAVNYYRDDQHEEYRAFLSRVLSWGLTPIVFLHSGDFYAGDDYYRGLCAWWTQHFSDLTDQCVFVCGWETRRFGGHRAVEFDRANTLMREGLGSSAVLAFHGSPESGVFGSHAPTEPDDPWADDDEPSNWRTHCGREFEVFLFQTLYADDAKLDEYGQPTWWNRACDTTERFLPAGTELPGAKWLKQGTHDGGTAMRSGYAGPDWFGDGKRARPSLVAFECVAWGFIRGYVSAARVTEVARTLRSFGFTQFGNGQP
jgi:hypothetical protein